MVFSSFEFIFIFLPISIALYYFCIKFLPFKYAKIWIIACSLFYYAYWDVTNLWIICFSILFNYSVGYLIIKNKTYHKKKKTIFILGLSINILLLMFYKYTNFILFNINNLLKYDIHYLEIILPIGISFFTFQQISYLIDIYTEKYIQQKNDLSEYSCFVSFFPQLVAGPIVHHSEMMPQFNIKNNHQVKPNYIYAGIVTFTIGLCKKICIADSLSPIVGYCFDDASSLSFLEAALGSLAYTMQLYFDFSGYADMAIGCALFFNIRLPENFYYPYLSTNIQTFWRRWHITLSRWLRNYIYIPLGGNRKSSTSTYLNIFITFLLGGIWHGAAWTFVLWGALHGAALVIQQYWVKHIGIGLPKLFSWLITFTFVNITWIFFRATSFERVDVFSSAFFGQNGFLLSSEFCSKCSQLLGVEQFNSVLLFIFVAFSLSIFKTNIFNVENLLKKPSLIASTATILIFIISTIMMSLENRSSEFIYFQF